VKLSVMEQRYQAVLAVVQDGWRVVEVARRLGVSRQSVHLDRQLRTRRPRLAAGPSASPPVLPTSDRRGPRSTHLRAHRISPERCGPMALPKP